MNLSRFLFKGKCDLSFFYFLPENLRRAGGGIVRGKRAKSQKKFSGEPEKSRPAGGGIVRGKESQSVAKKSPDRPEKSWPAGGGIVKGGKDEGDKH